MREVWCFLEMNGDRLHDTACTMAAEAHRTARIFKGEPCGILYAPPHYKIPESLKWYGLKKLYLFEADTAPSPEQIAQSLSDAARSSSPEFILFAHTPSGAEIGTRAAASLQRGCITRCIDFIHTRESPAARKPVYGGKADALITWMAPPPYLATIDLPSLEDVRLRSKNEPDSIRTSRKDIGCTTTLIKKWKIALAELALSDASVVIGVGKGVSPAFMTTISRLAELLTAVIGGTRIAVYSGLIPLERQIGTTGTWLECELYLAIGISGAPQHVMGIKDVKYTIAINISRDAPIFRYASLGAVSDVHEVIPLLITHLENMKKAHS